MRPRSTLPVGWSAIRTKTADGVRLAGLHSAGPLDAIAGRTAGTRPRGAPQFVVCHGMTNATGKPGTRRVLAGLARHAPVTAFDFRGHGASGGASTVGDAEVADAAAAVRWARAESDLPVVLVGFSMGGAVVLRQQGGARRTGSPDPAELADLVVSVSAPARWFLRGSRSMRRVQWLLEHPSGGLIGPRLGIRLGEPWAEVPTTPLQEVAAIAPTPLLIVHGTDDHYFGVDQARALHRAAAGSELLVIDGMGHAESGISIATIDHIAEWARTRLPAVVADDPETDVGNNPTHPATSPVATTGPGTLD